MKESNAPGLGTLISATFLVGGTIIGGGMLALPVVTGISGFWPSATLMLVCWLMMTLTALLFMEVSLWMEEGVHVISMTSRILGPAGKWVAWVLYLFICYASLVGYAAGGGVMIADVLDRIMNISISNDFGALVFMGLFGTAFYFGNKVVGRINAMLFTAMIASYAGLVGMGINEVKPSLLNYKNWQPAILAIPVILTSFSFQTMVPSLTPYLKRHKNSLRIAIVGGTTIALLVYLVWQWLMLGIVPVEGENGLAEALRLGEPATQFVTEHVHGLYLAYVVQFFAFFALVTSFLGMGLGLFDFLSDGLKIEEKGVGKFWLTLLIGLPTLFFATQFERIFLLAFDATGGYGDSILNGLIPVMLVWVGKYHLGYGKVSGGLLSSRPVLAAIFIFFLAVLLFKISLDFGIYT